MVLYKNATGKDVRVRFNITGGYSWEIVKSGGVIALEEKHAQRLGFVKVSDSVETNSQKYVTTENFKEAIAAIEEDERPINLSTKKKKSKKAKE